MTSAVKVGGYLLALAAVFAVATVAGQAVGPLGAAARDATTHDATGDGAGPGAHPGAADAAKAPGGLQVAEDGYRLQPLTAALTPGTPTEFTFRVLGPDAAPVIHYTPTHERDLHLIVVRRDLTGYQHLHPTLAADGTWRVPLTVASAGQYRIFADFRPAGRAEALTLGVDLPAPGSYAPVPLPPAGRTATVDDYTVELVGDLVPGTASRLALRVSRAGRPVTDLEPYLGAYGHLVTLRDGDLAYLHTHPDGAPADGRTPAGPDVVFHVEVPSAATYRLYLDFQHAGVVRTAAFTVTAGPAPAPATGGGGDHGHPGHG